MTSTTDTGTIEVPADIVLAAIGAMEYAAEDLRERAEYDYQYDDTETGDNRRAEADEYDKDARTLNKLRAAYERQRGGA